MRRIKITDAFREPTEEEYISDGGLIYCKKCRTPRQMYLGKGEFRILFNVMCSCQVEEAEIIQKREDEIKKAVRIAFIRNVGIPIPEYRNFRFETDDGRTPEVTRLCKRYVEKFEECRAKGQGLIFYGSQGTGKTFFSMCIANALIDKGYVVQETSLARVVQLAQDFDNAESHYQSLMNKHCIVLDDFGTERNTSFGDEQVFKHIDGWNTLGIPLIVTTNLDIKEVEHYAADMSDINRARVSGRILERCFPVKVNDVKRRTDNTAKNRAEMIKILGEKK